jgi:hypothetical protein
MESETNVPPATPVHPLVEMTRRVALADTEASKALAASASAACMELVDVLDEVVYLHRSETAVLFGMVLQSLAFSHALSREDFRQFLDAVHLHYDRIYAKMESLAQTKSMTVPQLLDYLTQINKLSMAAQEPTSIN